ncbi:MAG: hypothetical protein ACPLY9_01370 [Nitrososphaerales archaeon]
MASKSKTAKAEETVKCSDCGRVLSVKDHGLKWDRCQVCNSIICVNCMWYNRVRKEGLYSYYYDVIRVCRKHVI